MVRPVPTDESSHILDVGCLMQPMPGLATEEGLAASNAHVRDVGSLYFLTVEVT